MTKQNTNQMDYDTLDELDEYGIKFNKLGEGQILPIMALREVVIFPHAIMPLFVGRETSIKAIEQSIIDHNKHIFLVTQKNADKEKPAGKDLYPVGVVSRILQLMRLPDGSIKVLFEGLYRAKWEALSDQTLPSVLQDFNEHDEEKTVEEGFEEEEETKDFGSKSYPCLLVTKIEENEHNTPEAEALYRSVHEAVEEFAKVNRKVTPEHVAAITALHQAGELADTIMPHLRVEYPRKQEVLEISDVTTRLEKAYELLSSELTVASLEKVIKTRVKDQMERNQRDYYLSEQIKAIHKEMGNEDPHFEMEELEKQINAKNMPEEAKAKALREHRRLRPMSPASAEYTVARNYIDWILDLPWHDTKDIDIDIAKASKALDDAHFGLEKPKERILEYLAVQKLTSGLRGPILCFVGPPGVGKTSLAKSVAEATGRDFVRISLGGVRDEAEIRGHRRTYVGAMPGKILTALKKAKTNNPLFCLDEIDKMTSDLRGDPASALLEVLDPEQNNMFNDHYIDLDYDLSKIFFITTANTKQSIPAPLLDRMEIIELSSYLETEKVHIANDFLFPKQWKEHGLTEDNLHIDNETLVEVIRAYTREAGVRNLERQIAALCRKTAIALVDSENPVTELIVTKDNLNDYLGVKKHRYGDREQKAQVGVVTGLAFNSVGGDILYVETALMLGTGKISTTGQLGEVMTESAQTAFTYIRSRANIFGLKPDFYKELDIHVHVPEGGTPKDGPSAGITLATSIASALLGIPVLENVAMTGEITLRGRVLPIGGLREKLLAARRSDIKTVIIPKDNEKDLKDIPKEILEPLTIILVENMDEVLPIAFGLQVDEIYPPEKQDYDFLSSLRVQEKTIVKH